MALEADEELAPVGAPNEIEGGTSPADGAAELVEDWNTLSRLRGTNGGAVAVSVVGAVTNGGVVAFGGGVAEAIALDVGCGVTTWLPLLAMVGNNRDGSHGVTGKR